jgi:NAD(P)-dependent dehydrogenase (short-subunit alcohol dehydrogenase family)
LAIGSQPRRVHAAHCILEPRMNFDFSGRQVFVAGASSGIKLGIADAFARAAARIAVTSRSPAKAATAAAARRSAA